MISLFHFFLSSPLRVFIIIMAASLLALAGAITAQFIYDLHPCILCLYQRYPFIAAIIFGLAGLVMKNNPKAVFFLLSASAAALFINAGVAFFHSGVELHWWKFGESGCAVPPPTNGQDINEWIAQILTRPSVPCDVIAWKDPILKLSMANLNIVYCFALGSFCALAANVFRLRQAH
jgi:disulfide bond formation protein DsbB